MRTNLILSIDKTKRSRIPYDFEASVLFALTEGRRRIYGFDYGPPCFQQKLLSFLGEKGEFFNKCGGYVRFTVTRRETIAGLIPLVNWTHTMIFILDQKGLDEVGTPVVRYLWFIFPSHMKWFLEHIADWDILCFVGTGPYWGLDIRSERIGHSRLYELVAPVITEYGLHIGKAKAEFELE